MKSFYKKYNIPSKYSFLFVSCISEDTKKIFVFKNIEFKLNLGITYYFVHINIKTLAYFITFLFCNFISSNNIKSSKRQGVLELATRQKVICLTSN